MTKKIYLIRHGETDWNKIRRFQGCRDISLNETGRQQALKLQQAMEEVALDRLLASDLQRARETAEILNQTHGLNLEIDAGFREMNFGVWEGLNFQEVQQQYPDLAKSWQESPDQLRIPGGESFQQLFDRVWRRFDYWTKRDDYESMAIVCHGGTCAALICGVLQQPVAAMWQYGQGNTAVNLIEMDDLGQYVLKSSNRKTHLSE